MFMPVALAIVTKKDILASDKEKERKKETKKNTDKEMTRFPNSMPLAC